MPSEDTRLEVLHAHYLDTFAHIQVALRQRDRLFAYIVVAISVMLLQVVAPNDTGAVIGKLLADKLGLSGALSLGVLISVLWFCLLGFVIRYFQSVVHAERQYDYIHALEELLSSHYERKAFTREGASYLSNYPVFSRWAWVLYTMVFPGLLLLVLAIKLGSEFCRRSSLGALFYFDATAFMAITISTVLYLSLVHLRR